jgi:hypothetical protein
MVIIATIGYIAFIITNIKCIECIGRIPFLDAKMVKFHIEYDEEVLGYNDT